MRAGNGPSGGEVLLTAGAGGTALLTIMSGSGTASSGNLTAGTADLQGTLGDSGDIVLTTGTASTGQTGDVAITTGELPVTFSLWTNC